MPDDIEETLEIGTIVGKKYRVMQKLGEGGCGTVFKVEDTEDKGQMYALKVEFNAANIGSVLKMEVQILSQMQKKRHVAKCVASGKKERYCYMVMTLLGDSLDSITKRHGPFLNVSTQMRVGISLLFGIKQLHDIGYIHRDLKPANVALGYKGSPDERYFMVLDFGLARQYITDEQDGKKMRRPRENAHFRGTSRYCSIAMHDHFEQGRVDDLWGLIYMLAELRCRLTWHDVDDKVEIGEMKRRIPDEILLAKSPTQMLEFVKIVRNTNFYDRPDYEKLFRLLDDVMVRADYKWSDPYHWEPEKKEEKKKEKKEGKTKKLVIPAPSMKSTKIKKTKAKQPTTTQATTPPTGKTSDSLENPEAPYFTLLDFKSNPIGF